MGRLLAFLYAYRNLIWFIAIQAISVWLLASYNNAHTLVFNSWGDSLANAVANTNAAVSGYFNLAEDNEKLLAENIALRQSLLHTSQELEAYKYREPLSTAYNTLPDSLIPDEQYRFIPARALHSGTLGEYNYLKLDVGRKDGAEVGMGVISENGVAGLLVEVAEHYSLAMSLLNSKMRVNARILEDDVLGSFRWTGGNPRYGYLEHVPLHFHVKPGQTVVTSSQSNIFPPGYRLGTIDYVDEEQPEGFYNIRVKIATDFYRTHYLYLVKNIRQAEIDSLRTDQP
ncbi:MAG: rod shape-determining protein MreC [Sphingobacteriia bacterium]